MNEPELGPIPKRSLREEAYHGLRRAIVSGALQPGAQLTEPQLARQFQISRSPIREALHRLQQEGFAVRRPNGRIFVAPLDAQELEQLYAVRAVNEGLAASLAASSITDGDIAAMEHHLEEMRRLATEGDVDGSLQAGQSFHDVILERSGNVPLVEIVRGLRLRISRFRTMIAAGRDQESRAAEHREILEALRSRDRVHARCATERHIHQSAASVLNRLGDAGDIASEDQAADAD